MATYPEGSRLGLKDNIAGITTTLLSLETALFPCWNPNGLVFKSGDRATSKRKRVSKQGPVQGISVSNIGPYLNRAL